MNDIITVFLLFSGTFMILGGLFCWHAFKTYDAARKIMETLTDLIMKNEGTN